MKIKNSLQAIMALSRRPILLAGLIAFSGLALANDVGGKNYPPYPDVWDWISPARDRLNISGLVAKNMPDGDVLIAYSADKTGTGTMDYRAFFAGTRVSDPDAVFKGDFTNDAKAKTPFGADTILFNTGGGWRSGGCLDALNHQVTVFSESNWKTVYNKTLLYVFDKPKRYVTHPNCWDGPSFDYRVTAVDAKFLALQDGTFLLLTPYGYILRFDKDFKTKSNLINRKFFWIDTDVLDQLQAKYGDRAKGDKDTKHLYSDLYQILMTIKNGGRK